jgi:hypothetical protein
MAEKKILPVQKKYYDVKIDVLMNGTFIYKVLAEDPEQAILLTKNMQPTGVKYKVAGAKKIKAYVYDLGSSMLRAAKNMVGLS